VTQRSAARPLQLGSRRRADLWLAATCPSSKKSVPLIALLAGRLLWRPGKLAEALRLGAAGLQVGHRLPSAKNPRPARAQTGSPPPEPPWQAGVFTDPLASPAGFPFKVAQIAQTLSDPALYETVPDMRPRLLAPPLPQDRWLRSATAVPPSRCRIPPQRRRPRGYTRPQMRCNGLPTTWAWARSGPNREPNCRWSLPGDDLALIAQFLTPGRDSYSAAYVLRQLLAEPAPNS